MTRKVFIGVLAALMLFAFVACDNSGSNAAAGYVAYVEAATDVVYVEGETPKAEDFTFTGYDLSGNSVGTLKSELFTVTSAALKAGDNDVTFEGMYELAVKPVEINAKEVTEITVNSANAKTSYYDVVSGWTYEDADARKTIDETGLVVTAVYDGGSKAVEGFTTDADTVFASVWGTVKKPVTKEVTVTYAGDNTAKYNVTILPNYVDHVEMAATEDYAIYYDDADDLNTEKVTFAKVTGGVVSGDGIYMVLVYQGGEEVPTVDTSKIKFYSADEDDYSLAIGQLKVSASGVSTTAKYTDNTDFKEGAETTADFSVDAIQDEIVSITLKNYPASLKIDDYSEEAPSIATDPFKFEVSWLSGKTETLTTATKTGTEVEIGYYDADDSKQENSWILDPADLSDYDAARTTIGVSVTYMDVTEDFEFSTLLTK